MISTLASTIAPDVVISFEINPGTLLQFLESRAEGGPRLKCVDGSVTLVSPGMPHEVSGGRLSSLILAHCYGLRIKHKALSSTTCFLPLGTGDTAYEADAAYYIQSHDRAKKGQPPDLALEIVVSHSEKKALRAGTILKIPEVWVFDVTRHRLTFYHLSGRGKWKGTYRPATRSRAFLASDRPKFLNILKIRRPTTPHSTKIAETGRETFSSHVSARKAKASERLTHGVAESDRASTIDTGEVRPTIALVRFRKGVRCRRENLYSMTLLSTRPNC